MSIINASLIKDNPRHKTGLFLKKIARSALIITAPARVCERTYSYSMCATKLPLSLYFTLHRPVLD